jgi:WD40 repeat protein
LITAGLDGVAEIWQVEDGTNVGRMEHDSPVAAAAFDNQNRRITACDDGTIRIWHNDRFGTLTAPILRHAGTIRAVQMSPGGETFLTSSDDRTVRLWNITSASSGREMAKHDGIAYAVAYGPEGQQVLSAGFDGQALLIDRETGKTSKLPHADRVLAAAFSPNGKDLLTACRNGQTVIWDRQTAAKRHTLSQVTTGTVHAEFGADGSTVVTSCNGTTQLWDTDSGELLAMRESGRKDERPLARILPDGKRVVIGGWGLSMWDPTTNQTERWDGSQVDVIAFDPTSARMAVVVAEQVHIYEMKTGNLQIAGFRHRSKIRSIAFSPDGQRLATAGTDRAARIWDSQTARPTTGELRHRGDVVKIEFSADGRMVATASLAGEACVWDAATGEMIAMMNHPDSVWDIRFHPNGRELVTVNGQGDVLLHTLEMDGRSADQLQELAELLSGQQLRSDGMRLPIDVADFAKRLRRWAASPNEESICLPADWASNGSDTSD